MKSAENLYLVATLLLFLVLPFQNCTISPLTQQADISWSDSDPSFPTEFSGEVVEQEKEKQPDIAPTEIEMRQDFAKHDIPNTQKL